MDIEPDANPIGSEADQPSLTLDNAVALLEDEPPTGADVDQEPDATEPKKPDESEDAQEAEDDEELEGEEADAEADEENPDGDDESEDDEEADEAQVVVRLKDGTELTAEQVETGHMHQYDYTKKTEALAEEKRTFTENTASINAELQRQNAELSSNVDALAAYMERSLPAKPEIELLYSNPNDYHLLKELHESARSEFNEILQGREQLSQQQANNQEQRRGVLVQEREAKLLEIFPDLDLSNSDKRANFDKQLHETGKRFGFSEQDVSDTLDPRVMEMAHYAGLYLKAQQRSKKVTKKAVGVNPVIRPGARKARPNAAQQKQKKAVGRFRKTGSINDAMSIDFD